MASGDKGRKLLDAAVDRKPQLQSADEFVEDMHELYDKGFPSGEKTGWTALDNHYTVAPGQLTVVTGWPGSGKSEFMDALMINLAGKGMKFAVFSFENHPITWHLAKLMEKIAGAPFGVGQTKRVVKEEINEFLGDINRSFAFCRPTSGNYTLKNVIDASHQHFEKYPDAPRGLVIDPWNELEHRRQKDQSETEYVSSSLSMLKSWALRNKIHVWIIAHPQKMIRDKKGLLPVPRPDMISGSQNWWNKADAAICIHRGGDKYKDNEVGIYVQKIRFKHIGRPGLVILEYDSVTGRYSDRSDQGMPF